MVYCGLSEYIVSYFLLMAVSKGVLCVLECSQCMSDQSGDCANNPPPATPCNSLEEQLGPVNCMTAKRTNATGYLVQFIRGCTGVWISSGCMEQTDESILCYEICSTNNCNSANQHQSVCVSLFLVQVLFVILCKLI